jgi:hypothetical protein
VTQKSTIHIGCNQVESRKIEPGHKFILQLQLSVNHFFVVMYGAPIGEQIIKEIASHQTSSAATLSQPTVIIPSAPSKPVPIGLSWNEVQTVDGRVYFYDSATQVSRWDKPDELRDIEEQAITSTDWKEYKIWDGRTYFNNSRTKCSVWTTPPDVALARFEADPSSGEIESHIREYLEFAEINRTSSMVRSDFIQLLEERGIMESTSFKEAVPIIKDDSRYQAVVSVEQQKLLFASFISRLKTTKLQCARDEKRVLLKQAISDFQHWSQMNESTTHQQMEAHFKRREWFKKLDVIDVRKVFELYSQEFIEISKIKKQKLQDTYMQDLKNDILDKGELRLSSPTVVDDVFAAYKFSDKPFWEGLNESQKLIVIKSCINQRIRESKLALMNRKPVA